MFEMIKMVVVLGVLGLLSGGSLAYIHNSTKDQIESQELKFVKGPAIMEIFKNVENNPIEDRFKIIDSGKEKSFFIGKTDGKADYVAFESSGVGFGGDIGVMIGVNVTDDQIVGVEVTTHAETPGIGARAKTDQSFVSQFKGFILKDTFKVKADGGQVDAMSGATVTSRAISTALTDASAYYQQNKSKIVEQLKHLTQ